MTKTGYDHIYTQLRSRTEGETYPYQDLPASEHALMREFDCSRSMVCRAIDWLADEGCMQSIHGKGMQMIYQPQGQSELFLSDIENMREVVARNERSYTTQMVRFVELTVDEKIQVRTIFPLGEQTYYIQRVRRIDGEVLIIDHNYFLKCVAKSLIPEIVQKSIYEYMEQELRESTVTTKRRMTAEQVNQIDEKYLDMKGYNCMTVVSSMTYNVQGIMFESIQSCHRSDRFVFYDLAHRAK